MYSTVVHPVLALGLIVFSCIGASVVGLRIYRWFSARLGGTQYIKVRVNLPGDRSVKRDVDDMVLNDMVVGEPEEQIGEY